MLQRLLNRLHLLEDWLLAGLLGALLLVAVAQIGLRMFFESGLAWAEPVSQMGVLWLALMGALGAARSHRHISVDALPRLFSPFWRRVAWVISQVATAVICGMLAWYGWGMLELEREAPSAFIDGVSSWVPMLAFPFGFGLLSLRFAIAACVTPPEHEGPV
jgi:TRAP-type C4-dicarboxylate transport system permease small subunit